MDSIKNLSKEEIEALAKRALENHNKNTSQEKSKKINDSVLKSDISIWEKTIKRTLKDYWSGKFADTSFDLYNGNELCSDDTYKLFNEHLDKIGFETIKNLGITKALLERNATWVIHMVPTNNGILPYLQIASGLVRQEEVLGEEIYTEVVENITRGTIPIIKITRYGEKQDTISYSKDNNFDYDEYDDKAIKDLLNTKKTFVHNYGVVRATTFRNKPDDDDEAFRNGMSEYTDEIAKRVEILDFIDNRAITEILYRTTHLSINIAKSSTLGQENIVDIQNYIKEKSYQNYTNGMMINFQTADTLDGVDTDIYPDNPELQQLLSYRTIVKSELNDLMRISIGFDKQGKTNDTSAEVDRTGDFASEEANKRAKQLSNIIKTIFKKMIIMTNQFNDITDVEVRILPKDYRKQMEELKLIDKLSKLYPLEEIYMKMGYSRFQAKKMMKIKEDEVRSSLTGYAFVVNGNMQPEIVKILAKEMGLKIPEELENENKQGLLSKVKDKITGKKKEEPEPELKPKDKD